MDSFEARLGPRAWQPADEEKVDAGAGSLVLVVLDVNKELTTSALDWALSCVVQRGDTVKVLGILHHILTPMGYKSRADENIWNGSSRKILDNECAMKKMMLQSIPHMVSKCEKLGVKLEIDVKAHIAPKKVVVEEAKNLKARYVVIDRNMKKDKKYYIDNLTCFVTRVRTINDYEHLRHGLPMNDTDIKSEHGFISVNGCISATETSVRDPSLASSLETQAQASVHADWAQVQAHTNIPLTAEHQSILNDKFSRREFLKLNHKSGNVSGRLPHQPELRMGTGKKQSPGTPPLCSVCHQKSPEFGKVKRFQFIDLQEATNNFSAENYLAEGAYGLVYKGRLKDGQLVAVKQHRLPSSRSDEEFCSEVEVLSCAQHRNLVTLIGYCVENHLRLLVYEYVCNGSLDQYLSSKNKEGLQWKHRYYIALGAGKALRYLHEECRVGCIVHRDMRPNNILLTHDFIPMVGDFGLARRQSSREKAEETQVIGTMGYLAPEYAETGQITDKADVYAFGVVLLELITGRKAINYNSIKFTDLQGFIYVYEWQWLKMRQAQPLLDNYAKELVDPRLKLSYDDYEMHCMMHAANQCIKKDPAMRPRMTQLCLLSASHHG
ncbi:unnamed protein product [Sphagnum jensenii]|uniref:Protein kinase domain-containing protein n=1 Tax=Sphagnum jensenii TaxID=128206 RepID=A0ABP0X736_9BRYO